MWVALAVVTAVAFAATGSYAKALSKSAHVFTVTWALITLPLPWAAVLLAHQGVPPIGEGFFLAAMASVVLNMAAVTLQITAMSIAPLSTTVPFLALTPVFMLVTSVVILKETPDAKGLAGIILVAAGAYTIYLDRFRDGILEPLKAIATERGSRLMLLVALFWSLSAALDKVAVLESSPAFYTSFFCAVFGLLYAPFLIVGVRKTPVRLENVPRFLLLGAFGAAMILSQFAAIELTIASYVIAIKRAGTVLSVIFGYFFFKEKHLRARLAGASLMMLGVILISV